MKIDPTKIIETQCRYCHYLHLNKCTYENLEVVISDCGVFKIEVNRWEGYFQAKFTQEIKDGLEDRMIKELKTESPHLDNWWDTFWKELK